MSDLYDYHRPSPSLRSQIPPGLYRRLLFLDNWTEPPNFRTMGAKARHQLQEAFQLQSVEPTRHNFWVWFGAYSGYKHSPVCMKQSIVRVLFLRLRGDIPEGRRLTNSTSDFYSDVNPWKHHLNSLNDGVPNHIDTRKKRVDKTSDDTYEKMSRINREARQLGLLDNDPALIQPVVLTTQHMKDAAKLIDIHADQYQEPKSPPKSPPDAAYAAAVDRIIDDGWTKDMVEMAVQHYSPNSDIEDPIPAELVRLVFNNMP